jgi:hypothetical protein
MALFSQLSPPSIQLLFSSINSLIRTVGQKVEGEFKTCHRHLPKTKIMHDQFPRFYVYSSTNERKNNQSAKSRPVSPADQLLYGRQADYDAAQQPAASPKVECGMARE